MTFSSYQKIRYAAVIFILLITPLHALAQTEAQTGEKPVLEADSIVLEEASGIITATGRVDLRYQAHRLYADKLTWQQNKAIVIAEGRVRIHEASGIITRAERVQLSETLLQGAIEAMRLTLPDGAWMRAAHAKRDNAQLTLTQAQYTACPECPEKPDKTPLWRIRAARVFYDQKSQNVSYRHARLAVLGVPILYTPYLVHPGPEVKRRSGFLAPSYQSSGSFGFGLETPYFFNLAPNYDLTLAPRFTTKQGVILGGTWRHLTQAGRYSLTAYAHKPERDLDTRDGDHDFRGGLIGQGQFDFNGWQAGFRVEESSDDSFFRRYHIHSRTILESNVSLQKQFGNHNLAMTSHRYRRALSDETDASVDYIAPRIHHTYRFDNPILGGALQMSNNFVHSIRGKGLDITTLGTQLHWQRRDVLAGGWVLELENRLDADSYYFAAETTDPRQPSDTHKSFIANATGLALAYPLMRHSASGTQTLTPRVQIIAATKNNRYHEIPYRTIPILDLSGAQLFQLQTPENEASRINYGITYQADWVNGVSGDFLIGQSYDLSARDFAYMTGYRTHASAIITQANLSYGAWTATQNMRLSRGGDRLLRNHIGLDFSLNRFSVSGNYNFLEAGELDKNPREEIYLTSHFQMNEHWRISGTLREDLEKSRHIYGEARIGYEDECIALNLSLGRDYTHAGSVEPETQVKFTFILRTLGN